MVCIKVLTLPRTACACFDALRLTSEAARGGVEAFEAAFSAFKEDAVHAVTCAAWAVTRTTANPENDAELCSACFAESEHLRITPYATRWL